MSGRKSCYYDVLGRHDLVYTQHFVTDGFVQDWLHFHSRYELSFVLSGEVELNDGGQRYNIDKPHIRLHRPFAFHTANAKAGKTYECFVFYFTEESLKRAGQSADLLNLFSDSMRIVELEGDLLECAKNLSSIVLLDISDDMRALVLKGLLTIAEENYPRGIPEEVTQAQSCGAGYIKDVLSCIDSKLPGRITAAELAKQFFVSEQKLSADFKNVMNETLHHYIVSARISHAAMLIAKGQSPLSAAMECGFVDETHFSKTFKDRMGITPAKFSKTVGKSLEYPEDFDPKNTTVSTDHPDFYNNRTS